MACEQWREALIERLVDELDEDQAIRLEQHLAECVACRREEAQLRMLFAAAAPAESWDVPPEIEKRLHAWLRAHAARGLAPSVPRGAEPSSAASPAPGEAPAGARRRTQRARLGKGAAAGWLALLTGRMPAFAALPLAAAALLIGLWVGQADHPLRTEAGRDHAVLLGTISAGQQMVPFVDSLLISGNGFATSGADALSFARLVLPDSL
jgi:anti-sigma factor RsiW